jgi:hypothetical protein
MVAVPRGIDLEAKKKARGQGDWEQLRGDL